MTNKTVYIGITLGPKTLSIFNRTIERLEHQTKVTQLPRAAIAGQFFQSGLAEMVKDLKFKDEVPISNKF